MAHKLHVDVRDLSREESLDTLARHHIGHVALSFHDVIRLKIANYLYSDGWIYARTELGDDVTMARHHPWGVFEVSEIEGIYDWRSVEVWGAIEFMSSDVPPHEWFEFEDAVKELRKLVPQVLTANDPMPLRVQMVRIHADKVVGRASHSNSADSLPHP